MPWLVSVIVVTATNGQEGLAGHRLGIIATASRVEEEGKVEEIFLDLENNGTRHHARLKFK